MATLESFIEHIWKKVGPACREQVRESLEMIERVDPEDRPKLLASFYWANWCRGRNDQVAGNETFWDLT